MNSKISNGKGHLVIKHSPHLLLRLYVIMYGLLVSLSLSPTEQNIIFRQQPVPMDILLDGVQDAVATVVEKRSSV